MMEGRKIQCEECNRQSLMTAVNKFVSAVSSMDEQILVPNRLRDMEMSEIPTLDPTEANNNATMLHMSSSGQDLYNHYVMLNDIKHDVISGKGNDAGCELASSGSSLHSDDSDDSVTDAAGQAAEEFRYHLHGLFAMLHQLTDTAKLIGNTYENEVGANKKLKKFVI